MSAVRVRMYRQGLGDCFLLRLPGRAGDVHVLIDCGVLTAAKDGEANVRRVAQNVVDTTNGKLDVLVATHEHWDHVSGFVQAQDVFARLEIGEVWLAWTENPGDDMANELRKRKARALRALVAGTQRLTGSRDPLAQRTAEHLSGLLEFFGGLGATGQKTTAAAMDWVKGQASTRPCGI